MTDRRAEADRRHRERLYLNDVLARAEERTAARLREHLADRKSRRFPTPVEVLAVDGDRAHVVVVGWHIDRSVAVPLAPIVEATGLTAAELPGRWLEATANCYAWDAGDLVLTDITIAPDLPAGWLEEQP